jgi:5-methyltetrahydropteroyltriglutamate--homocysteine methyltransferase
VRPAQLDEPVLSEVVFTGTKNTRSFMCGALSEKADAQKELELTQELINAVVHGLPRSRLALHICRGNWTRDEQAALAGDYRPLLPTLWTLDVGTFFLELAMPRAGEMSVLRDLPADCRVGIGLVNKLRALAEAAAVLRRG